MKWIFSLLINTARSERTNHKLAPLKRKPKKMIRCTPCFMFYGQLPAGGVCSSTRPAG